MISLSALCVILLGLCVSPCVCGNSDDFGKGWDDFLPDNGEDESETRDKPVTTVTPDPCPVSDPNATCTYAEGCYSYIDENGCKICECVGPDWDSGAEGHSPNTEKVVRLLRGMLNQLLTEAANTPPPVRPELETEITALTNALAALRNATFAHTR